MDESKFLKAMEIDKKVADGKLRLILLKVTHQTNTPVSTSPRSTRSLLTQLDI